MIHGRQRSSLTNKLLHVHTAKEMNPGVGLAANSALTVLSILLIGLLVLFLLVLRKKHLQITR